MGLQCHCPLCSHPMWGTHSAQQDFALLAAVQPQKGSFCPQKHHSQPAGTERVSGVGTVPSYLRRRSWEHRAAAPGTSLGSQGCSPLTQCDKWSGHVLYWDTQRAPLCCSAFPCPSALQKQRRHRTVPAAHRPGMASTEAQALHQAALGPQEKIKAKSA